MKILDPSQTKWLYILGSILALWFLYQTICDIVGLISHLFQEALADSMIKGAFVMGILFTLKDQALVISSFLWNVTVARSLLSLKISSDADNKALYTQISFWLAKKFADRIPNKKANSEYVSHEWLCDQSTDDIFSVQFNPDDGVYLITYQGAMISLNISSRALQHGTGFDHKPVSIYTLIFSTFGWNSKTLDAIVSDAQKFWDQNQSHENTVIKQAHPWWPQGKLLVSNPKVDTLEHLCLDLPIHNRIFKILDNFKTNAKGWKEHNQVHRESILLVGPPGNGKTKLLSFIAGYLNYDIMLVNLSSGNISDDTLLEIFARVPKRTLIALEEIDSAVPSRDVIRTIGPKHKSITMSGLLQALDGPVNKEGPMIVATTNRYESLDPALIRPGRFNHHIKLDWSTKYQQEKLFRCYFPDATPAQTATFAENLAGKQISCVTIVSYLRLAKSQTVPQTIEEVLSGAKLVKPSHDVSGEKVHLDSPCNVLLEKVGVSSKTIELLFDHGVQTLRHLKFASISDIYSAIEKTPKYKLQLKDESQLLILHEDLKNLKDDVVYLDFEQPISQFFKGKKISEPIVEALEKHFGVIGSLSTVGVSDLETIFSELSLPKPTALEQALLKPIFEEISKATPLSKKKYDLDDLLSPALDSMGVTKETQKQIEKLGILTLRQFNACGVDKITGKFSKPKRKITMEDKTRMAQAIETVTERIEEREIFV